MTTHRSTKATTKPRTTPAAIATQARRLASLLRQHFPIGGKLPPILGPRVPDIGQACALWRVLATTLPEPSAFSAGNQVAERWNIERVREAVAEIGRTYGFDAVWAGEPIELTTVPDLDERAVLTLEWAAAQLEPERPGAKKEDGVWAPFGYVWRDQFLTYMKFKTFLKKHPEIRTDKSNLRRPKIHLGDWHAYWFQQANSDFDSETVFKRAAELREGKASAAAKRPPITDMRADNRTAQSSSFFGRERRF
ncbi:MAG: hypothetical protein ACYC35_16280 [Pirellulales bacterium]